MNGIMRPNILSDSLCSKRGSCSMRVVLKP